MADKEHADRLERSLAMLRRRGVVRTWSQSAIEPGADLSETLVERLDAADVVLLLFSPDFLESDFCYETQWQRALRNHHAQKQTVVPLIVRPCDWEDPELLNLEVLLRDPHYEVVPVTQWPDSDAAWQAVVDGIKDILESRQPERTPNSIPPPSDIGPLAAPRRERLVRWALVWRGTVAENNLPMAKALLKSLSQLSEDERLTALRAEPGSVRLVLLGTQSGFERIRKLHTEGLLEERLHGTLPGQLEAVDWEADVVNVPGVAFEQHSDLGSDVAEKLKSMASESGFEVVAETTLLGRAAIRSRPPRNLHPAVRELLDRLYPQGIYSHQAKGLHLIGRRRDICLATATASGKSLVFMAAAADRLKRDPDARVLALYPAKALIQDQRDKWNRTLAPLGMAAGYIDGGVATTERPEILQRHRVLLMTPDVTHAWLMSNLSRREVADFVTHLRVLILDEAHVYDGVFGTNMAYFIRRLLAVSGIESIVSSTATVGAPWAFIERLTGRRPLVVGEEDDGSVRRRKEILVARPEGDEHFEQLVTLLVRLARSGMPRFLAFADSRKMVEQVVASAKRRAAKPDTVGGALDEDEQASEAREQIHILPYRAGYEEEDRREIQASLANGRLAGVVSTSALELGLDIGDIGIVLLLGSPPSVKSFWQRVGRAGRAAESVCLVVDAQGFMTTSTRGLQGYLERPAEPGWLYLDNQYIQYAHALCAAAEVAQKATGTYDKGPLQSLPDTFVKLLENELNPTEAVPDELYPLKQRAQDGPQYEFPLRNSTEKTFDLKEIQSQAARGRLAFSQVLREAYPGAIHYYMAQPYRVRQFNYRTGEIGLERERGGTTRPDSQNMVFPKLPAGVISALRSDAGFVVETALQVNERVQGFVEQRGASRLPHRYGPGSPYWQQPLVRFFQTTGVCWYFRDKTVLSESVAEQVLQAFCAVCGIQDRDLGISMFHAKPSTLWPEQCQGMCIYDAVDGSLRLTSQFIPRFADVLHEAIQLTKAQERTDDALEAALVLLAELLSAASRSPLRSEADSASLGGDWVQVIAPHQRAMYQDTTGLQREVEVIRHVDTREGLKYQLVPQGGLSYWAVAASTVTAIFGVTAMIEVNLMTGETRPVS